MTLLALAVTGRGLVDPGEPVVRADDEALLRGRAAFETLKVYGGRPFRLEAHLDRLTASAESIGLPPVERLRLQVLTGLVLPKAAGGDASLRLVWTAGPRVDHHPAWRCSARSRAGSKRHGTTAQAPCRSLGVRAAVPWLLPGVKSTSYAVNMAAEAEAKRRGADEAVFVDTDGIVLEGTVTNVWWRTGDALRTPSLDLGILAGVTRATLIELAPACGYRVEEGAYPLEGLLEADEAFTSSSVREIMPLVEIDGRALGRGPAADELQQALRTLAAKV